jgi:hypothetical protein
MPLNAVSYKQTAPGRKREVGHVQPVMKHKCAMQPLFRGKRDAAKRSEERQPGECAGTIQSVNDVTLFLTAATSTI